MRLIEKVWFHQHSAKIWLVPLLLPLMLIFWLISACRRLAYQCRIFSSIKVNKPIIVIGNIGIGGNGKTPIVLWLIDVCRSQGLTPGVISRGYGGKAPYYPYMITDESTADETGDEPLMIYHRTNALVCVGSDRIKSANKLIDQGCDVIIADDGLQHYRLQRDIEFLVVDGKRRFGNGLLLPAGPLREGLWRLNTVDYIINNGGKPRVNEIPMQLVPNQLINCKTGEAVPASQLYNSHDEINAIAGIGDPDRFYTTLRSLGFIINDQQSFVDHHHFNADDLKHFLNDMPLLMTEKDAIKCRSFAKDNWWYLTVDAHIPKIEQDLLATRINQLVRNTAS